MDVFLNLHKTELGFHGLVKIKKWNKHPVDTVVYNKLHVVMSSQLKSMR